MNKKQYSLTIPSSTEYLAKVEEMSTEIATGANFTESECDDIGIAVTELVNNAIHHGNKDDVSKNVEITFEVNSSQLTITIKDEGTGFNPDDLGDPLAPENIMKLSGRGIFLIKNLLDDLKYDFNERGTTVTIVKKIK